MKNTEHDTDLEFLASLGEAAHGGAQPLPGSLRTRWQKKYAAKNRRINFALALLSVAVMVLVLWYNMQPTSTNHKVQVSASHNDKIEPTITEMPEVLVKPHDLFERVSPAKPVEAHVSEKPEAIAAEEMQALPMAQLPQVTVQEDKLRFMINTPLFYIHDLKVSNYQLLYFRKNKFVPAAGVSADKISKDDITRKEGPDQWLHENLADALLHYRKAEYIQCVQALNEVTSFNSEDINCDFYRGMSWYHMKHFDKAISFLTKCEESTNNAFLQEAQYYKALSYEASGQEEKAKVLFKKIAEEGEFYSEKAKEHL